MGKFFITLFENVFGQSLRGEETSLDDLHDAIKGRLETKKADLPLAKSARFGQERTKPDKNGKGGGSLRHDANVTAVSGVVGDYDGEIMSFDDALARLQTVGFACLIHTTPSHHPTKPRWRVWAPFSRELPVGDYARMADRLNGAVGGVLARESWPPSQAFYVGHVAGVPFDSAVLNGEECIDECSELDQRALPFQPPTSAKPNAAASTTSFTDCEEHELFDLITSGTHYWRPVEEIAYRRAQEGASAQEVEEEVREALDHVPQQRNDKWNKAGASLKKWVARAYKRADQANAKPKGGGRPLSFPAPQPWPDEVDGAELLDEIAKVLRDHVVMSEAATHAVALWTLHTYVFTSALVTPRLLLKSAQKRCGKSTLLAMIGALSSRALPSAGVSAAAVYRTVEMAAPTLLIDEADTFLPENEELRGVLNAGFIQGGQVIRVVGDNHEPRVFNCCCPVAIAAIRHLPDTIEDRSVAVVLQRLSIDEPITRLRQGQLALLTPVARRAQRWADDHRVALETADPFIPDPLNDRAADCWRVLLAIAEQAGEEWADRARAAAIKLALDNADTETTLTLLLADLRDLFDATGTNAKPCPPVFAAQDPHGKPYVAAFSADIVKVLADSEDRPWPEFGQRRLPITPAQLARVLAPVNIHPSTVRRGARVQKGYRRDQFDDAFRRYLR